MTTGLSGLRDFRRLRYFHGQMLAAADFQREQEYFVEKLRLRNRCLHGYGVACGLLVSPAPPADACGAPEPHRARVTLHAGVAVDCLGNEIVIRRDTTVELLALLPEQDRAGSTDGRRVYLSVEFCERDVEPTRGVHAGSCGATADCEYGWRQDHYRIRVTVTEPDNDGCADLCCGSCAESGPDPRLLLARIDDVRDDRPVRQDAIHLGVRRPLGRYRFTTITGISWQHGGYYTIGQAAELLGARDEDGGLRVCFSGDVQASCLTPGIVDVQVTEAGDGHRAGIYLMNGHIEDRRDRTAGTLTRQLRWRQASGEPLRDGDRVLVTVRTPFILDRCCRPVDGTHAGGRVPPLTGCKPAAHREPDPCGTPPSGAGPWTSGTGTGDGVFQSWFFVRENHEHERSGWDEEGRR
jgi:hypothetical protein